MRMEAKGGENVSKPYQLNISPTAETLELLDDAVLRYGKRHRGARNRAVLAAEVIEHYLLAYLDFLEKSDKLLNQHLSEGKVHAASHAPTRRTGRA